jgi:transcriptional regulator with XRE-family HTH domain
MEEQRKDLARRVAELQSQKGWTNEQLAYRSGLSVKTISRVLNGHRDSRGATVRALADAFDVPEGELRGVTTIAPATNRDPDQLDRIEAKLDRVLQLFDDTDAEPPEPPKGYIVLDTSAVLAAAEHDPDVVELGRMITAATAYARAEDRPVLEELEQHLEQFVAHGERRRTSPPADADPRPEDQEQRPSARARRR